VITNRKSLAAARRVLRGIDVSAGAGRRQAIAVLMRAGWYAEESRAVVARLAEAAR
jgi:hypothetical protein